MTSLQSLMASDSSDGGTFFPKSGSTASGFNELVTYYPEFSDDDKVENVNVVVIQDNLEGTREVRGDGVTFNRPEGRRVRRSIVIELPTSYGLTIRHTQPIKSPDAFKLASGEYYIVKRILGQDADQLSVLCVAVEDATVRSEARAG